MMTTTGDRIRRRREEIGITQEELARKLGYTSATTVSKLELGANNLRQSKIKALADALQTTPEYIMGWTEQKDDGVPSYYHDPAAAEIAEFLHKNPQYKVTEGFIKAVKESGCPHFRFHDLRHYGISILHAIGIPDQFIMARSGHSTDYVMKRVYRHAIDAEKERQTRKINEHFSEVGGARNGA